MIKIYNDFQKTYQDETTSYVKIAGQIEEYIPLRQWLRRALNDSDHDYALYIQRPLLAKWLDDLRNYPSEVVCWIDLSLRDRFQEIFGFAPPVELDDDALNTLQILELDPPSTTEVADPIGWILGHKLDPVWKAANPYQGHLAHLAAWAATSQPIHESLRSLAKIRLADWATLDNRYQFFLEQLLPKAGEAILLHWALQNYPDDFRLSLQQQSTPLEDCRRQSQPTGMVLEKYRADLRRFWQGWLTQHTAKEIPVAVKMMSGVTKTELNILVDWLQNKPTELSNNLLEVIRHHFTSVPDLEETLKPLELLIAPPVPQMPQPDWSTEQWLVWATTEYMPYFTWTVRQRQPRHTQMELAQKFGDWLVAAYPSLIFGSNTVMVTTQQNHLRQLFATNQVDVILWLIIDGLTWWQGRRLMELYTQAGLGTIEVGPHLSALPSVTTISKRAIAQGYLDHSPDKLPVAKLLENRLKRDDIPATVHTQVNVFEEDFLTITPQRGAYILFYNALDRHNHDSRGFTLDESVDGHLQLIVRLTNTVFQQCIRQGLRAKAVISSDHGSTLLPTDATLLDAPQFAHLIDDETEEAGTGSNLYRRTRVCAIEREPSVDELVQLETEWYLLRSDVFNLPQHFVIPRGYAAVKRRPSGWTHGGATPEETVTPFYEVHPQLLEIVPPIIKIDGSLRAGQNSQLQITIVNPNPTPFDAVRFNIVGFSEILEWSRMQPQVSFTQTLMAPAATSKDDHQTLEWILTCEVSGRRQFSDQIIIPVRRFQRSAADELFEEL